MSRQQPYLREEFAEEQKFLTCYRQASDEQIEAATRILQQPIDDDHVVGMETIMAVLSGAQIFETRLEDNRLLNWIIFPDPTDKGG